MEIRRSTFLNLLKFIGIKCEMGITLKRKIEIVNISIKDQKFTTTMSQISSDEIAWLESYSSDYNKRTYVGKINGAISIPVYDILNGILSELKSQERDEKLDNILKDDNK